MALQWSILTQAFNHQSFSRPSRPLRVGSPESNSYWGPSTTNHCWFSSFSGARADLLTPQKHIYMIYLVSSFQHELGGGELGNDFWASVVKSSQAQTGCRVAHRVTLPGSQCLGRKKRWKIWGTHHLPSWFHTFPHLCGGGCCGSLTWWFRTEIFQTWSWS